MGNKKSKMQEETEKASQIIPEEEMQRMKAALVDGDITDATERIKRALEEADNVPLNIAVTGESGVGKSTFVNAIRGLSKTDKHAAPTGVNQTTMFPTPYPHPRYKNVIFWDLPGVGTEEFKASEYLEVVKFHTYDLFFIIGQRFTENQSLLVKAVNSRKKICYLLRSKVDQDIANELSEPNKDDEERLLQEMREDIIKRVKCQEIQKNHTKRIFLISSHFPHRYEFSRFLETLEGDLPDQKTDMFVRCVPTISAQILEKKKKVLKHRIWQVSLISAGVAAIPVPGLSFACDVTIIATSVKLIRDDFGLTWANLEKLSNMYNKDINELISVIKSPFFNLKVNKELVIKLLLSVTVAAGMVVEYALSTVPGIGSIAAGGISFATTYCMLNNILEEIAADSQRVLTKALEGVIIVQD